MIMGVAWRVQCPDCGAFHVEDLVVFNGVLISSWCMLEYRSG